MNAHIIIISAPSGAGKSTLCRALLEKFPDIGYSISHTTRLPRSGETDGADYHFIGKPEFERRIRADLWAEWAEVHGNLYGTSSEFLDKTLASGHDVLLDIDVRGMTEIIRRYPDAITIFVMPPSMKILEQRLRGRGTDSEETIAKRLKNAEGEIAMKDRYRHILVNDDLAAAKNELFAIIRQYRPTPIP